MAIDATKLIWGEDNQYAYDPISKQYLMGSWNTPATPAPKTLFGTDDMGNPIYTQFGEDATAESHPWTAQGYFPVGGYQYTTIPIQNSLWNKYISSGQPVQFGNVEASGWKPNSYTSADFTNVEKLSPEYQKYFTGGNGSLSVTGWDAALGAPYRQQITQAPEESFLSSFMQGPGMVLGSALGANALFGGGLPGLGNLFGGGSSGGGGMFDWLTNLFSSGGNGIPNMADPFGYNAFDYSGFNSGGSLLGNAADAYNFPVDPNLIPQGSGAGGNVYGPSGLTNTLNNLKTASSIFGNMGGGGALGGLLGALAGGIGANSKPAGTTTSIQDIPDYLKPYQSMNLTSGVNNFANASAGQALLPGAQQYLSNQIAGKYLDPNQNPAFQPYVKDLMGQAGANYAGLYGKNPDNLNNSGFQEGYTRAITNAVLPLYNSAFQTAQGNQYNAASNAPQYAGNVANAALAPNLAFKNLYTGPQATSQPYFTNPLGGALSGGLAGYQFGNSIFGSKN